MGPRPWSPSSPKPFLSVKGTSPNNDGTRTPGTFFLWDKPSNDPAYFAGFLFQNWAWHLVSTQEMWGEAANSGRGEGIDSIPSGPPLRGAPPPPSLVPRPAYLWLGHEAASAPSSECGPEPPSRPRVRSPQGCGASHGPPEPAPPKGALTLPAPLKTQRRRCWEGALTLEQIGKQGASPASGPQGWQGAASGAVMDAAKSGRPNTIF